MAKRHPWLNHICCPGYLWSPTDFQWGSREYPGQLDGSAEPMMTKFHDVHYNDVIMGTMSSQITRLGIVYSSVYSVADQRKHQSSASLAFVRGIHQWLVNSPHKGPVTQKMFTFDDVIMLYATINTLTPWRNGRHFADDIFKCNFLDENVWIPIKISLTFVPQGPINNIPALDQIMAWRRPGGIIRYRGL